MGKSNFEILSELRETVSLLRQQIDIIENKIEELEAFEKNLLLQEPLQPIGMTEESSAPKEPLSAQDPLDEETPETEALPEQQAQAETAFETVSVEEGPVEDPAESQDPLPEQEIATERAQDEEILEEEDIPEETLKEDSPEPAESQPEQGFDIMESTMEDAPIDLEPIDFPFEDVVSIDVPVDLQDIPLDQASPLDIPAQEQAIGAVEEPIEVDLPEALGTVSASEEEPLPEPEKETPAIETKEEPKQEIPAPSVTLIAEEEPSILTEKDPAAVKTINDSEKPKKAVMDVFSEKLRWKTDMPGTPVKNIVSAISLNDRALFINTLFNEDPILFKEVIAKLNDMTSLEEALNYLGQDFSHWNMKSEGVYRFMMAVRRKLK